MKLTRGQDYALQLLSQWWHDGKSQVFRLSGYAGTGKSTIIARFADDLGITGDVKYIAYTGKATQVLVKKGLPSSTIHRLIYNVDKNSKKLKFYKKEFLEFNPSLIVVDEASMVDEKVFADLLSFGVRVVVVGDPGQLPPIQGKSSCLANPDVVLTEVVRQALDNPIVALATFIRQGRPLQRGTFMNAIPIADFNELEDKHLLAADQVLCGTNRMRAQLNDRMRQCLGRYDTLPEVGEKVISLRNLWSVSVEGNPIVNGTTGTITRVVMRDLKSGIMRVVFRPDGASDVAVVDFATASFLGQEVVYKADLGVFDFGYAITCHKSQGSEYNKVALVVDHNWGDMHSRWLYTGITRAVDKLAIALV